MTNKIGNGSIPLRIGRLIDATVYGGPYREVPVDFWGVKMAEEIDHPHMVDVPTKDYCVPKVSDLQAGIVKALMAMINEEVVYVGCWGGIGRTGIFLAALAKVQIEYRKAKHRAGRGEDPVLYVRKHFLSHAVETTEQEKYIANLDVSTIVSWLDATQTAMGMGGLTPARETELVREHVRIEPGPMRWVAEEDKSDNPAFDRHSLAWKGDRTSEQVQSLVERDLDWIDDPDADSAKPYLRGQEVDPVSLAEHLIDTQDDQNEVNRIVERRLVSLEERVELTEGNIVSLETLYNTLQEYIYNRFKTIREAKSTLTNATPKSTLSERIRRWLKEN